MESREGGCVSTNKLSSRILKGFVGNLKKLGLGFELNERRRRREGI
jgi:hypothetical protein